MGSLSGRVALITGAGRGIGRAEALFFAAEGAKVVVNDPGVAADGSGGDRGVAAAVAEEIVAAGGEAIADTGDVTRWEDARRMVEAAVDAFGDLHIVVNNAAIEVNRAMEELTEREFDDVLAVKVKGTFAVTRWAARYWRDRHRAGDRADRAVINTASGSGLRNPLPGQSNYAAGNAAVAALTVVHALELARSSVRVNCVSPSMVRTRLTQGVPGMPGPVPDGFDPHDPAVVAPVAAYLATADCPLTGQVLSVRGTRVTLEQGWSAGPYVDTPGTPWTVAGLATAMGSLPCRDPFDALADALTGALGSAGRAELQAMIAAQLDAPSPSPGRG